MFLSQLKWRNFPITSNISCRLYCNFNRNSLEILQNRWKDLFDSFSFLLNEYLIIVPIYFQWDSKQFFNICLSTCSTNDNLHDIKSTWNHIDREWRICQMKGNDVEGLIIESRRQWGHENCSKISQFSWQLVHAEWFAPLRLQNNSL